jgi:hypothetical protein
MIYAKINNNNIVIDTILADEAFINAMNDIEYTWVVVEDNNPAIIGGSYSLIHSKFIHPQPYPSWTLDDNSKWQPPIDYPADSDVESYMWNEDTLTWDNITGLASQ